jgi:S-formylglutathione hydrolase FrmB
MGTGLGARSLIVAAMVTGALALGPTARADRLPSPAECAAGTAAPLTLGTEKGAAAVCAGPVYAGGNPKYPCGTILVGPAAVAGTPDDDPGRSCDGVDPLDDELRYRVGLPPGYDADADRRWPVIYLLPGGGGDERSWETFTDIVPLVTATGVIVVLPYGGLTFHTDWEIGERRAYERAFVERLVPEIDATYRTLSDRDHRAIGGFSRGGYGAMLTAARHPDLFAAAGSFSGALDPMGELRDEQLYLVAATAPGRYDEVVGQAPWFGDPISNELGWRERSPIELARALSGTNLWVSAGNGAPDDDDADDPLFAIAASTELLVGRASATFHNTLVALGIAHHYDTHAGVHDYRNAGADVLRWAHELKTTGFGSGAPEAFNLRNADPTFSAYGWTFAADAARAGEFLDVTAAGRRGVTLAGSGATSVTTAPLFTPGHRVDVTWGGIRHRVQADDDGRLRFVVDLGPPHRQQQFTVGAARARQKPVSIVATFTLAA